MPPSTIPDPLRDEFDALSAGIDAVYALRSQKLGPHQLVKLYVHIEEAIRKLERVEARWREEMGESGMPVAGDAVMAAPAAEDPEQEPRRNRAIQDYPLRP